jgi:hypothetical protein
MCARTAYSPQLSPHTWLAEFMQAVLYTMNEGHDTVFVIQRKDNLQEYISTKCVFDAKLTKDLMLLLIDTHNHEHQTRFIWINEHGYIMGINSTWNNLFYTTGYDKEADQESMWKSYALHATHKTDALILKVNAFTRTFDFATQGTTFEHVTTDHLHYLLKKYLLHTTHTHNVYDSYKPQHVYDHKKEREL